jgi:hypothetical protein
MRTPTPLLALLGLLLVATAGTAAFASAQGGSEHANESAADHPGPHGNETNETRNETDEHQRHDELEGARHVALSSFQENRSAALKLYRDTLDGIRASFLENKTKVIDGCRAERNATKGNGTEGDQHCVRDGLKPLIEKAHADIRAAQDKLHDTLVALRTAALAQFGHHRDEINERHHHG